MMNTNNILNTTSMSKEPAEKVTLKKGKLKLRKEISSLKKLMNDYKLERRVNWKSFKKKMNDDIDRLKKISK